MKRIVNIETSHDYHNALREIETLHPLVSVINFHNFDARRNKSIDVINFDVYGAFLKDGSRTRRMAWAFIRAARPSPIDPIDRLRIGRR